MRLPHVSIARCRRLPPSHVLRPPPSYSLPHIINDRDAGWQHGRTATLLTSALPKRLSLPRKRAFNVNLSLRYRLPCRSYALAAAFSLYLLYALAKARTICSAAHINECRVWSYCWLLAGASLPLASFAINTAHALVPFISGVHGGAFFYNEWDNIWRCAHSVGNFAWL